MEIGRFRLTSAPSTMLGDWWWMIWGFRWYHLTQRKPFRSIAVDSNNQEVRNMPESCPNIVPPAPLPESKEDFSSRRRLKDTCSLSFLVQHNFISVPSPWTCENEFHDAPNTQKRGKWFQPAGFWHVEPSCQRDLHGTFKWTHCLFPVQPVSRWVFQRRHVALLWEPCGTRKRFIEYRVRPRKYIVGSNCSKPSKQVKLILGDLWALFAL